MLKSRVGLYESLVGLASGTINTDTTTQGNAIDVKDRVSVDACMNITGYTAGTATFTVYHGDTTTFGDATEVNANDLVFKLDSNGDSITELTATGKIYAGYVGIKRYVWFAIVSSDSANFVGQVDVTVEKQIIS